MTWVDPKMPTPSGARRISLWSVTWLTLVWLLLWGTLDPVVVVGGVLVALLVLVAFPLPRVPVSLRVRPWAMLVLISRFLFDLVVASVEVAWLAVRPGPVTRGVVMDIELAGDVELLQTITAEMVALVPGTVVIDLESEERLLTLHALDVNSPKELQDVRHRVLAQEARVVRALHPDPDSVLHPRRRRDADARKDAEAALAAAEEQDADADRPDAETPEVTR